jgi:hypothetical protein
MMMGLGAESKRPRVAISRVRDATALYMYSAHRRERQAPSWQR